MAGECWPSDDLLPPAQCSASKQRSVLVFRYGAAGGDIPHRLAFAVGELSDVEIVN